MKAKRKIDQKAIKQFFIDHTEKFAIGLVGLLFAWLTYQAIILERYQRATADLQKVTQNANATMQRGPNDPQMAPEKIAPIANYAEMVEKFKEPEPLTKWLPKDGVWTGWQIRPIPPSKLRTMPDVFPVEQLQAHAGRGAFLDNGGNANAAATVGQRWVVVTGLVPYRRQVEEYRARFQDSASEANMEPQYLGFLVQRGEVAANQAEPSWENKVTYCSAGSFAKTLGKWNGAAAEVVDLKDTHPSLTSPLPPWVNGEWGDEVAHLPEIKPLPLGAAQPNPVPGGGRGINARGAIGQGGRPLLNGPGQGVIGAGANAGPAGGPGATPPGDELLDKPKAEVVKPAADEGPEYLLVRYFDFDVESGKQYAYRVFAVMQNPNFGEKDNVLADADFGTSRLLGPITTSAKTDKENNLVWIDIDPRYAKCWSKSCESEKLPGDQRLLAGATSPPKVPNPQEFTGEVRVLMWDDKTGFSLNYAKDELYRGTNLVFHAEMIKPGNKRRVKVDPLDMKSILVNVAGGEPIVPKDRDHSPEKVGPGTEIVLNESGNLVILDEMGDIKEWNINTKEPETSTPNKHDRTGRGRGPAGTPPTAAPPDLPDNINDSRRRGARTP